MALGSACEAYADQVDDTRHRTVELAKWLLEQVVEGVAISVAIGAVTGGAGAAAGLAAVAARVAAESPKFLRLLEELRALVATASAGLRSTREAVSATRLRLTKFVFAGAERGEAGILGGGRWPRGWLRSHEHSGSHTLARHVGWTDSQLLQRLKDKPWLDHASTFLDEGTAESAIARALNHHSTTIRDWIQTGKRPLELDTTSPRIVGRCAGADGNIVDAHHLRVVLVRDASMPDGYRILTAYLEP